MDRWVGKVALVTGASGGIGAATVEALVREGLQVVGVARRMNNIEKINEKLKDAKGKLYARQCDLSKEEDILAVFEWIKENLGGVDVLVNNAGVLHSASLSDGDTEGFRHILDVNVLAVAISTREAVRSMKARQVDGHIININSVAGHYLISDSDRASLYPSSKFAVTAMTEVTRKELIKANTKIKITSISPGLVETDLVTVVSNKEISTEFYKANPTLVPEDLANAIVYALGTPPHVQVCELTIRPVGEAGVPWSGIHPNGTLGYPIINDGSNRKSLAIGYRPFRPYLFRNMGRRPYKLLCMPPKRVTKIKRNNRI